jgi:hypothetical protein
MELIVNVKKLSESKKLTISNISFRATLPFCDLSRERDNQINRVDCLLSFSA